MSIIHVERIGGLANFGGSRARIRSHGQLDTDSLSAAQKKAVDLLFHSSKLSEISNAADSFLFRITRKTATGTESVIVREEDVPTEIASCVKDEFV